MSAKCKLFATDRQKKEQKFCPVVVTSGWEVHSVKYIQEQQLARCKRRRRTVRRQSPFGEMSSQAGGTGFATSTSTDTLPTVGWERACGSTEGHICPALLLAHALLPLLCSWLHIRVPGACCSVVQIRVSTARGRSRR